MAVGTAQTTQDGGDTGDERPDSVLSNAPDGNETAPLAFFVSDRITPRRRRASDFFQLLVWSVAFVALGWAASKDPRIDDDFVTVLRSLPGWIHTLAWAGFTVGSVVNFLVVLVGVVRAGSGRGLVRDLLSAIAIAAVVGAVASWWASGVGPELLPEFFGRATRPPFPSLRLTAAIVVTLVLTPYVTVLVQKLLRWSTIAVVVSAVLLGLTTVTSLAGALALGVASVAAVRLIFGTPDGLPSISHLKATLAGVGTEVTDLAYRTYQPGTVGLATATSASGEPLHIKVYGIAAANRQRAERVWNALWFRTAGPSPSAGRIEQAQHEALALMTARASGVEVPQVKAAGRTHDGDVVLVTAGVRGTRLSDIDAQLSDDELDEMWQELYALHRDAHISHGRVNSKSIRLDSDGVQLTDLSQSSMFPTEQQLATDIVSMLAVQAVVTGADRSIDAAVRAGDPADLELCLPYVQDAVVAPDLRSGLRHAKVTSKELRERLSEKLGVKSPELASIRRVQARDIVMAVFSIIAASTLIGQIANVGLERLGDEIKNASWGWFVAAFCLKLLGYFTAYFGMRAMTEQRLPFFPTALLQSAKSFVGLVVPSTVGQVGLDIRYLQNLGVSTAVATTQGPIMGFIGFLAEAALLVVCAWVARDELNLGELNTRSDSSGSEMLTVALAIIAVAVVVVALVPKFRAKIVPALHEVIGAIKHVIRSPRIILEVFVAEGSERIISALALAATLAAFGAQVPFAAVIFVSVGTGLLAGLAPVPGGIGVAEATLGALLTAVGLPPAQAVTVAITYRLLTSYLPPVVGFFSFRWLTKEGYL